jgi:hypothetical protein
MGELSFLTIIVSLAVCSLLIYAVFQYMKVRLTILEQSHKEQAMILQQYIEESSSDIHRLYQMTTMPPQQFQPKGSIILEYANTDAGAMSNPNSADNNATPSNGVYHEPHIIHLDTAFFQNKRSSNLIEISSDSEDTTDSDGDSDSSSDSNTESGSESESSSGSGSDTDSESDGDGDDATESDTRDNHNQEVKIDADVSEVVEVVCDEVVVPTPEIKMITVDLGAIQETEVKPIDVLSMLYKNAQQTPLPEESANDVAVYEHQHEEAHVEPSQDVTSDTVPSFTVPPPPAAPVHVPLSAMSVADLKLLLKEKCKNQPEKHAEIQKLKKAELIYAIQQLQ